MRNMTDMTINLLLFGSARELCGIEECQIEVPQPATVQSAYEAAKLKFPALARFQDRLLIALNEEYVTRDTQVRAGDQLAIFPPVSGGSSDAVDEPGDICEIVRERIDYDNLKDR